jgi:hypothetical protein
MEFMTCGSCSGICQINNSGICLSCQRGFVNLPQEDAWVNSKEIEKVKLQERKEEIENALKESIPKKTPMGKRTPISEGIRTPHAKRKKTSQKS